MAEATSLQDRQRLDVLLQKLTSLIKKLPTMLPHGSKDGLEHLYDIMFIKKMAQPLNCKHPSPQPQHLFC